MWLKLSRGYIIVVKRDGKIFFTNPKGKEKWADIAENPEVKHILWTSISEDAFELLMDRMHRDPKAWKFSGDRLKEYFLKNYMKFTKKYEFASQKDRAIGA